MNSHLTIKLPATELKNALSGLTKVIPRYSTLPVLGTVHLERDRQGWVHLTATDLDTFLSLRLEAAQQIGEPACCLVPWPELQKLGKTCSADETLDLEVLAEDKLPSVATSMVIPSNRWSRCFPPATFPNRRKSLLRPSAWMKPHKVRC